MIKYSASNKEYGIKSQVVLLNSGKYSVILIDTDCGETLPSASIHTDLNSAKTAADKLVA